MKQVSLLVLALAFATGHAIAAPQSQSHAAHAPATAEDTTKAFDALDTNKDGQLSKEELAKDPMGAHAAMVDADRNGSLSREEFTALQKMKM
jgi:Ca2+-binding EF-hand superfamily protein